MAQLVANHQSQTRVALITGASSGIGAAIAKEMASRGIKVALLARRKDRLKQVCRGIEDRYPGSTLALEGDVTRRSDLDRAIVELIQSFGRLDYVVANAGFGVNGKLEKLDIEDYRRQFETNVFGVLNTLQASLPEIKKHKGSITLMGSVLSYLSGPYMSPYSMSKAAVRALADSLGAELAKDGVAVTLICPGFVASEIHQVNNQGQLDLNQKIKAPQFLIMSTDVAARKMVKAILGRRREIVITLHGKLGVFMHRHCSGLVAWLQRYSPLFS